ncbi:MAG: hypothetical protein O2931_00760 [Planctomycetota bacterium]|nr:hypothetical protein [Planctomycetota bacterium]MDA1177304.1 hypothetical protein [Planctomycetota bacterium]
MKSRSIPPCNDLPVYHRGRRLSWYALLLNVIVGSVAGGDEPTPRIEVRNLALSANITASSEPEHLHARHQAAGRISEAGATLEELGSWAVLGEE